MASSSSIAVKHLWRNDITGLRAIAVLPVLLYHAFPKVLPGGFFGVDVFFVISGYLISGIIFRGLLNEDFSYKTFYAKRIKRIFPNLLLLLTFVALAGYFLLLPGEYISLGKHIYSSSVFVQNFRLLNEVGYFTEDAFRKPLLHLWSLAIEEQFYIIFPIICSVIWYFHRSRTLLAVLVLVITFGSFLSCLLVRDTSFNFYFPLTRFWELGAGICLSYFEIFGQFKAINIGRTSRNYISVIGFFAIVFPMLMWSEQMVHPGWMTLFPVMGAVFMIAAHPDAYLNRYLLSWRPITFVGLISYSLYLWHWPILAFLFISAPSSSPIYTIVALLLSVLVATLVYFFVEIPARRSNALGKVPTVGLLVVGLILAFTGGQAIRQVHGFPSRSFIPEEVQNVRAVGAWKFFNEGEQLPYMGINVSLTQSSETLPSVLFAGDSHVAQYFSRAKVLTEKMGRNAGFIAEGGCFIIGPDANSSDVCRDKSQAFYKLLSDARTKIVVVGGIWGNYYQQKGFDEGIQKFRSFLMNRSDLKAYVLLDYPWTPSTADGGQGEYDPLLHYKRFSYNRDAFILPYPSDDRWLQGNEAIEKNLSDVATLIQTADLVCPDQKCDLLKWYRDDDHLQPLRIEKEAVWIDPIFEEK